MQDLCIPAYIEMIGSLTEYFSRLKPEEDQDCIGILHNQYEMSTIVDNRVFKLPLTSELFEQLEVV